MLLKYLKLNIGYLIILLKLVLMVLVLDWICRVAILMLMILLFEVNLAQTPLQVLIYY